MANVSVNFYEIIGKMKPMHAVNNGPLGCIIPSQNRNNFEAYKAARIPYARNHDASEWIDYGGEFVVDIYSIFPNFDADPEDRANYEFPVTDVYTKYIQDAGTETFYRLGARIEHQIKKYRTVKPSDYKKWAIICEHVIRHYNEGWADGFHYGIKYWEIWNEPDLDADEIPAEKKRCWSGTAAEFYEFYEVAAKHLKSCFPDLKIGGPALAHRTGEWMDGFLWHMTRGGKRVPLDFFSWHWYGTDPAKMLERAHVVREKLDRAGYTDTESILNEWNYVANWGDRWVETVLEIIGLKGASFITACMCEGQKEPSMDMMMYYDAAPCSMNGLFDFYTWKPIKGYWSIYSFADLYGLGTSVRAVSDDGEIYTAAAKDENGDFAVIVCYYTDAKEREDKTVNVLMENCHAETIEIRTVDDQHDYSVTDTANGNAVSVTLKPNTFIVLKTPHTKH